MAKRFSDDLTIVLLYNITQLRMTVLQESIKSLQTWTEKRGLSIKQRQQLVTFVESKNAIIRSKFTSIVIRSNIHP